LPPARRPLAHDDPPTREFSMRSERVMTMTFDVLRFVGLLAFRDAMPAPLFWISLVVAGFGLFAPVG
jgi:hypothetical protein